MPDALRRLAALAGGWLLLAGAVAAGDWRGQLHSGERVTVDARTHRARVQVSDGERKPLRDGVHALADGSVLIVRSGIAVPTAAMLHAWSQESGEEAGGEMCARLVAHSCGSGMECAAAPACDAARQLRSLSGEGGVPERREGQRRCREALINPYFTECRATRGLRE